jgi:hypothetical protein
MSRQSGVENATTKGDVQTRGENGTTGGDVQTRGSSKANLTPVIWITGMLLYSLYISNCFGLLPTFAHVRVLLSIHSQLNYKQ